MSAATNIEWCDSTFNPWIGCTRVSPACDDCYAARSTPARTLGVVWGAGEARRRTSEANWKLPIQWERDHAAFFAEHGRRRRVFCASLADVFDNEVDPQWRADLFALIRATPNLDWLLLTKRIGNAHEMIGEALIHLGTRAGGAGPTSLLPSWPWPHVWLGATVVNQAEADRDIPKLLAVPARVRFLSIEPMLGAVDLGLTCENWSDDIVMDPETGAYECCRACDFTGIGNAIDWVIAGGESGPQARPSHPEWYRSLRDQCAAAGVPFLFKQWGEWREPIEGETFDTTMGRAQPVPAFIVARSGTVSCFENDQTREGGKAMVRVGKKAAGRLLDGIEHNGYPEVSHG